MTEKIVNSIIKWSLLKKFLIIFLVSYMLLYMMPFPLDFIPVIGDAVKYYSDAMDWVYLWIGNNILQISELQRIEFTGSGDTTLDYVRVFSIFIISVLISIVVNIIDRKRSNYEKLFYWVKVYAVYYVGLFALSYGFAKVFEGQFPFPYLSRFEQQYGNSSPMGLLWTFMGMSKPYTIFAGLMEVGGGLLILFRRTRVIGAIILIAAMTHVAMLNFCYDVPVKLFSTHLLLFTIIILSPDIKNLYNFFILHKESSLSDYEYKFTSNRMKVSSIAIKLIIIFGFIALSLIQEAEYTKQDEEFSNAPLRGIYKTETFSVNNNILPPLTTDSVRWGKFIVDYGVARIVKMNDSTKRYNINVDTVNKLASLSSFNDASEQYQFSYTNDDMNLNLTGVFKGDSITATFKKKDLNEYRLIGRGFNWINEYPFNR